MIDDDLDDKDDKDVQLSVLHFMVKSIRFQNRKDFSHLVSMVDRYLTTLEQLMTNSSLKDVVGYLSETNQMDIINKIKLKLHQNLEKKFIKRKRCF